MEKKDIVIHILNKAKKEAGRNIKVAERVADRQEQMLGQRVNDILDVSQTELEGDAPARKKKIIGQAQLEAKNMVLKTKKELLNTIYDATLERLGKLDRDDNYLDLLTKFTIAGIESLGRDKIVLRFNEQDKQFIQKHEVKFLSAIKGKVARELEMSIADRVEDISGGVVITTPDEKVWIINSFEDILKRNWDEYQRLVMEDFLN